MKNRLLTVTLLCAVSLVSAQSKAAYDGSGDSTKGKGLIDLSRLSVSHSMSFGMLGGGGASSLQSQSFYSTMLQYRFTAPVTLNLNFSLPIHSSFSPYQNLTTQNMQSFNYFRNIPFDVSLSWKPSDKFQFNFSVVNYPSCYGYGAGMSDYGFMPWTRR